jgi:hypothetical protein
MSTIQDLWLISLRGVEGSLLEILLQIQAFDPSTIKTTLFLPVVVNNNINRLSFILHIFPPTSILSLLFMEGLPSFTDLSWI